MILEKFLFEEEKTTLFIPKVGMDAIRKNIKLGAKDVEQNWNDTAHIVKKAFEVSGINVPSRREEKKWKQYMDVISFAVKELSAHRGLDGNWRLTPPMLESDLFDTSEEAPNEDTSNNTDLDTSKVEDTEDLDVSVGNGDGGDDSHSYEDDTSEGKYFIELKHHVSYALEGDSFGEILENLSYQMRQKGVSLRLEHKSKRKVVLSVWHKGEQRDDITIHKT